ncbi:MAG: Ni/Fe-hydrogenase cytochrome b subunit [bacterium]|nr:Ni/Fe-hydrogenase cytochrome b subunit [bacterium]
MFQTVVSFLRTEIRGMSTFRKIRWIIYLLIIIQGIYLTIVRFTKGLGATTNLSDEFPWGFWIAFDVVSGVALAAGGFTLCFLVYLIGYHKFHSVVRATVLTAFLGYALVAVGLLYDLGKYYNVWHPVIMWNHHSVMFEVAWCVMLYLTVLFLEFLPVVLEKFKFHRLLKFMQRATIPLVIAGILLSTLHQSSLGSVFLIVPEKLHPIWYTPMLPLMFYLSAIVVGPAMVIVESTFSAKAFHRSLEKPVLVELAGFLLIALIIYIGVKLQDFYIRDAFKEFFTGSFESIHGLLEMTFFIVPVILLGLKKLRQNPRWIFFSAFLVVVGVVYNRFNVCWIGMLRQSNANYYPSYSEIAISLFLVTIGTMAFYFIARFFPIFPEHEHEETTNHEHQTVPLKMVETT